MLVRHTGETPVLRCDMAAGEFDKITIIGVGLLGGSLGLAVKAARPNTHIVGVGHRQASLDEALRAGAADEVTLDPVLGVKDAQLVVLCTPVGQFAHHLKTIAPALKRSTIVTDVGSTKAKVVAEAQRILRGRASFVGSHPIAGSEQRGVSFARTDLFAGKTCILTPTAATSAAALKKVERFWQLVGMRTLRLPPAAHDKALGAISHMPHALAATLVNMESAEALDLAGTGFMDVTRIASGDPVMWRDIFISNAKAILAALHQFNHHASEMEAALEKRDGAAIEAIFAKAQKRRADMIERRLRQKKIEG